MDLLSTSYLVSLKTGLGPDSLVQINHSVFFFTIGERIIRFRVFT